MRFATLVLFVCALATSPIYCQDKSMTATTSAVSSPSNAVTEPAWMNDSKAKLERELVAKYGEQQRSRAEQGLRQVAEFWRAEDGDAASFEEFVSANFAGDQATLDTMFSRFESLLEQLDGHMHEINREFRQQLDLDGGPILPFDEAFGGYDPSAHVIDDFFQNKLAFTALLNFPLTTLDERLKNGPAWSRRQWAEVRLADRFSKRVPADVNLGIAQADAEAGRYISEYNIWMYHLLDTQGQRLFPPKMRLLSHWNLRDEIKSDYADSQNGLAKQRMIRQVMERIVTQTIPEDVINNPSVDWNPYTNNVVSATAQDSELPKLAQVAALNNVREPDTRYAMLLKTFVASKKADPYSPTAPTLIARRFDEDREIPEERVKAMLEQVVTSPLAQQTAKLIETRLGRPLEPFDIWYSGFRPGSKYSEAELDAMVSKRYPTAEAYQKDIPNLLMKLGFPPERANYIAQHVVVDPARGAGHAMGAGMRSANAHLRTRVEKNGMNYKGFNIGVHEMGHNVEQTFSLNDVDHTLLQGVPNTAFTEALAFVFQGHDLELLGLPAPDARSEAERTLNDFWATYEISGVALVDMAVWHWMYDHPQGTPAQLNEATVQIAKDIWNRYYAPVFHKNDVVLLGVYSHMIDSFLYLPDYPIGHLIAFQIEEQMGKAGSIGPEFERMAKMGRVTPDLWMKNATGRPVGAEALLNATERSLATLTTMQ
ncbi:MAG: hypothetical protein JWO91_1364 [Acidobacteriaceae bacterium]|nr:hypothetical protein [Acidobacteriaceae bacterium]